MAHLLDNVLDSLQQKLETQLDSAVGIDLKADCGTESDEDEPGDVKALRARVRKAESDAKALLDEGADLSTKLGRAEQRNKTLRAELADRERVIARLESRGPPVDDGEERAKLEHEAASLEVRAASLELENGSLKRLAVSSAETRDKLAKTERLLAAAVAERDASRADAAAARRDAADALVAACVEINQCDGCTDNSSLSHFAAMTRLCWLGRAVRNRHHHAIEQASRRWRGGRRDGSVRTRREF